MLLVDSQRVLVQSPAALVLDTPPSIPASPRYLATVIVTLVVEPAFVVDLFLLGPFARFRFFVLVGAAGPTSSSSCTRTPSRSTTASCIWTRTR